MSAIPQAPETIELSIGDEPIYCGLEGPAWLASGTQGWVALRKENKTHVNDSGLPLADKLVKGQDIITKSTNNPKVPGNATLLAAFAAAQADLDFANNAEVAARSTVPPKMTARETAQENWMEKLNLLASFTESATAGDAEGIESAGFGVRSPRTPPQPLPAPTRVVANTNEKPGYTELSWEPVSGAKSYVVQISPDPIAPGSWTFASTCTASRIEVNGADAGKRHWYRVSAVNGKGQGPWSEPASRPVM